MNCKHSIILKGMCCECGLDFMKEKSSHEMMEGVSILHGIPELVVSPEEARSIGTKEHGRLLKARKLALIVDLDHTLVHSVTVNEFSFVGRTQTFDNGVRLLQTVSEGKKLQIYYRAGTWEFLRQISEYFEVHVFTLGTRDYADQVLAFLDPDSKLIGQRIRSRTECTNPNSKHPELSKIFPAGENMVCILDDRLDVWNNSDNVIQVLPFFYDKSDPQIQCSPVFSKHFNFDTLTRISEACVESGYFSYLYKWLLIIHSYFFDAFSRNALSSGSENLLPDEIYQRCINCQNEPDVKNIVLMTKNQILADTILSMAQLESFNESNSQIVNNVASFINLMGGKLVPYSSDTHIDCIIFFDAPLAIQKFGGQDLGMTKLVHLDWLYACYFMGQKLPYTNFTLSEDLESAFSSDKIDVGIIGPVKRKYKEAENLDDLSPTYMGDVDFSIFEDDNTLFEVIDNLDDENEGEIFQNRPRSTPNISEVLTINEDLDLSDEGDYNEIDPADIELLEKDLDEIID